MLSCVAHNDGAVACISHGRKAEARGESPGFERH